MRPVFFYISGHGFGHASRDIEVINAFGAAHPGIGLVVRTSAPRWLFDRTVRPPITFIEGDCDTGVVQIDSLRLDAAATIRRAAEFYAELPARAAVEADLLRRHDAALVIADAPPLACTAAAAAGVPSIVLSNFTWDWIYEGYAAELDAAPHLIRIIEDAYRLADCGWRMPMHGGFQTFDCVVDVPFIARHATQPTALVRERLGLPADGPLALSSFGGYGVRDFDPARLDCLDLCGVVLTGHTAPPGLPAGVWFIDERAIYEAGFRYEDLVAAVEIVVTKPGFGIIAECIANRTAMLYTSRGRFVEYDVMVKEMPRVLRAEFIAQPDLLAGHWRAAIQRLLAHPPPPDQPRTDGAAVVAQMIAEKAGASSA